MHAHTLPHRIPTQTTFLNGRAGIHIMTEKIPSTISIEYTRKQHEKTVKPFGSGGHVILPKSMVGKDVLVVEV